MSSGTTTAAAAGAPVPVSDRNFYGITLHKEIFSVDMRYVNLRYIGGGAYGSVCAAEDRVTGRRVALKKCRDVFRDPLDAKRILREMKLLRCMGTHENLLWILDVFVWPNFQNFKDLYIVTDLMETDLARIIDSPQPLTNSHLKYFTYQLVRGLKFLHSAKILHRDLKPQNILVNANCELVIGDYGLARVVGTSPDSALGDEGDAAMGGGSGSSEGGGSGGSHGDVAIAMDQPAPHLTSYVVTRWYRAPELLLNSHKYDGAIDIWSVGCTLAEMISRKPLLPGRNYQHQLQVTLDVLGPPPDEQLEWMRPLPAYKHVKAQVAAVRKKHSAYGLSVLAKLFPSADPQAVDLMARMLCFDPTKRITVEQALTHPYLSDYHDPTDEPTGMPPPASQFEFEQRSAIPKPELQAMMIEEMHRYRSLGEPQRPQSTRLSAHSYAQQKLAAAAAASVLSAAAAAAAAVTASSGAGGSTAPGAQGSYFNIGAANGMDVEDAGGSGERSNGAKGAHAAAALASESSSSSSAAASEAQLLEALSSQMKAMRDDILGAVEAKVGAIEGRLAKLESQVGAAAGGSAGTAAAGSGAGALPAPRAAV